MCPSNLHRALNDADSMSKNYNLEKMIPLQVYVNL